MKKDCVFCGIVNGRLPATILAESETCLAIMPKQMEVRGHHLILPKQHIESMFDVPEGGLAELMNFAQEVCVNLQKNYGVEGVNLLHASGVAAQQSVPHFHIHLLPRFEGDGVNAWPSLPGSDELLQS